MKYHQHENGRRNVLSPTFPSSLMNPVFVCTNGAHGENPFIPMNESICVQMSTFTCKWVYLHKKHSAHLPPWALAFRLLVQGARKQRVNRRTRMPAIFQKLNGNLLRATCRKNKWKQRAKNEEKWKFTQSIFTAVQIRQVGTPPLSRAEAMANWSKERRGRTIN